MGVFADFLTQHEDAIVEEYLALVYAKVQRYAQALPETFPENTRRLVRLFPIAAEDAQADEIDDYVDSLVQQRLPAGFQLTDIMEAMFLYDDVILPMVWRVLTDPAERQVVAAALHQSTQAVALKFARRFVELQLNLLERQRQAVLELSTPVIKMWDGILTLPLIGTIDSYRARQIMEELLSSVAKEQAAIVLIDITGVPVVDTNVADHLIKTVRAAELLGAECLLVGIGPELAQTLVSLGIDLRSITTAADLRQGLNLAFHRVGLRVVPNV